MLGPVVRTRRLLLRPLHEEDVDALFAYRTLPDVFRLQTWKPSSRAEVLQFIAKVRANPFNTVDTWFQFAVCRLDTKEMIGDVGVHFLGPENLDFELGFTINPKHQKKGFAREAAVGIVDHLFTNNFKRRAIAVVEPTNNSSIVLVEKKLQMKLRIVAKENANVEEDRVEDLVFEIQREEWIKLKEEGKIGEPSLRT